jgi:hypothetical protein
MFLLERPNIVPEIAQIAGEGATPLAQLPIAWQQMTTKDFVGMRDRQGYVEMAQLFHYKLAQGDVDLFNERPELAHLKAGFCDLFGQLADETLAFYAEDFRIANYPDFEGLLERTKTNTEAHKVAQIGQDLFAIFGYDLPASFYEVHLAPIDRDHLFEERALRFDRRDIEHKRSWDAALHACKVFAIQMTVQSIASKYGFTYQHGCGCNSHISNISLSDGAFDYHMEPEKRSRWIRSFVWTMWYEYAFFAIVPNTVYLV